MKLDEVPQLIERIVREGPDALLEKAEVTALIASRLHKKKGFRVDRNAIGMRIERSLESDPDPHGVELRRRSGGLFTIDDIFFWATRNYQGRFGDLPHRNRNFAGELTDGFRIRTAVSERTLPNSIEMLKALVQLLWQQKDEIEAKWANDTFARKAEIAARFKKA